MPTPTAPSGLTATGISKSEVDLAWVDNSSDETGFILERSADAGVTWAEIIRVGSGVVTFKDYTVSASVSYQYRVTAYNSSGSSAHSATASVTVTSYYIDIATVRTECGMTDSTTVPDSFITARIAAAQDVIDDRICDRYALPLTNASGVAVTPLLVAHLALEQSVGLVLMTQFSEESKDTDKGWAKRLKYVDGELQKVQDGKAKLRDPSARTELVRSTLQQPDFYPTRASNDPEATNSTKSFISVNDKD